MEDVPTDTALDRPDALIVATAVIDDAKVTVEVISFFVESLYMPVAVNCVVTPTVTVGAGGPTEIDIRDGTAAGPDEPPPPQPVDRPKQPKSNAPTTSLIFAAKRTAR